MKKIIIILTAVILAACTRNGNKPITNTIPNDTIAETETIIEEEPVVEVDPFVSEPVIIPAEPNWDKPLYCIGVDDDTVAKWVYDEQGRIAKILLNFDSEGRPKAVRTYEYVGDTVYGIFRSNEGTEERHLAYLNDRCEGLWCAYDLKGRLIYVGITYDPENSFDYDFAYTIELDEDGYAVEELGDWDWTVEYDQLGRILEDSRIVRGLDIEASYYEYEGRLCQARKYSLLYVRDENDFIVEDYEANEFEYNYEIYY